MPGWGWFIIGFLFTAIVGLVLALVLRKPKTVGLSDEEMTKLKETITQEAEEKLAIEKYRRDKLRELLAVREEALTKIQKWYDGQKGLIERGRREAFEKYMADNDAAGGELDKLIGLSPRNPTG
jgi:hypothetical protein